MDLLYQHRVDRRCRWRSSRHGKADAGRKSLALGIVGSQCAFYSSGTYRLSTFGRTEQYAIWWREPETKIFPTLEELGIGFVPCIVRWGGPFLQE